MAKTQKPQAFSSIFNFFVNYANILCKQFYVYFYHHFPPLSPSPFFEQHVVLLFFSFTTYRIFLFPRLLSTFFIFRQVFFVQNSIFVYFAMFRFMLPPFRRLPFPTLVIRFFPFANPVIAPAIAPPTTERPHFHHMPTPAFSPPSTKATIRVSI